jgi:DNA-binding NarL/FixJ family response regulator
MNELVILITASPALTDYWVEALDLSNAIRLTDANELFTQDRPAGSMVLWDLARQPALSEAKIMEACQRYQVLALTSDPSDEEGMRWLQWGASGYAHALSTADLLQQVFDTVNIGGTWVGRSIMQQLCARFGRLVPEAAQNQTWSDKMSGREAQVVDALRQGMSNKEIARQLGISERTVKAHLTSVFQKFGVEDRLQLLLRLTSN